MIFHLPAVVSRPFPALGCCYRLGSFVDTRPGREDIVAEGAQDGAEEAAVLHAIAASASAPLDDFVKKMLRVEIYSVVRRVMELEVFEGDGGDLMPLQGREK